MRTYRQGLITFLCLLTLILSSSPLAFAFDEGMYTPDQIAGLDLKKRGLKIKPSEIYNPGGVGLTDAVIRLSIGCSAEFVSPDGLILTNHHCGFDALVKASTPDNDLVENGFKTDGRSGEIPAKGYSITLTQRIENVTPKITAGTDNLTGADLAAAIKKNTDDLTSAEQAKNPGSTIRILPLNNGFFYYLYQTTDIKDIRVVYAPPRNIGVFGGDPDNFEWTRHTGDFTFLRAYVAPDGSAAPYAAANVPYKPKKFLKANIGGVKDGDFVFVMGFPGNTTRYRESWSIKYARDINFPFLGKYLTTLADSLRSIGAEDEEKRIELQSDIANFDNSRKVYVGGTERLHRAEVVQKREAEESRLAAWIAADPERQKKYGSLLSDLKTISEETNATGKRDVLIRRLPDPLSMPVFGQIYAAAINKQMLNDTERAEKLKTVEAAYKDREPAFEVNMLKFFFKELDALPSELKFKAVEDMFGSLKGQARREAEAKFADRIANGEFSDPNKVVRLYGPRTMEYNKDREEMLAFARAIADEKASINGRTQKFAANIDRLRLNYMRAMSEMKNSKPYPDANFTMRFSYGNIKGYVPREAEMLTPFTTMKGMLEKDTGKNPFDMPQKLKDLQAAKDFGRYGSGDSVIVNFLSSTDIIGGNSGSPILNGNGEQVGICFDGNYEGLGNDFYYDPAVNRTISADIRFVLFVTEKFGGAKWVVDEMSLVGGGKKK